MARFIPANATASTVREELHQLSQRDEWNQDEYWKYFLKIRKELFDEIYFDHSNMDWRNPGVTQIVVEEFIRKGPEKWSGPENEWVLAGGWINSRNGIVAWLRSSYWKHNKKRMVEERDHRNATAAASSTFPTASAGSSATTASALCSDVATVENPEKEVNETRREWKHVVL